MNTRIVCFVSVVTVLAFLSPLIAACAVPITPTPATAEKFDLRVATINDPTVNKVMDILVAGFGAKNPNINVKLEFQVGDYAEKMFTMAAAGTLPDVVWTADIFTLPFVKNGVLLDMQPLAEKDPDFNINDIYPSILGLGRIEGDPGLYMLALFWIASTTLRTCGMIFCWTESSASQRRRPWHGPSV